MVNNGLCYNLHINKSGRKIWFKNDRWHRLNGPAVIFTYGAKEWYQNGFVHRLDGPAIEYESGYKSWWYEGKPIAYSQEEFERLIKLRLLW
jgi:hypothetical protein